MQELKRKERDKLKENLQKKQAGSRISRKPNKKDEPQKPKHFDFAPLAKALRLFRKSNPDNRSQIRQLLLDNKKLISSFFVNEEGEPSETRCFDLRTIFKRLIQNKVAVEKDLGDIIGMTLMCFGKLEINKREVMRIIEEEVILDLKDDKIKKKAVKVKKEKKNEEESKAKKRKEARTSYLI